MDFASRIVAWQIAHGRHDLPWQRTRDPYRIWLSEIMLQQTQVATVIGYYERFLARFPDIASLAAASQDDVMPYWAGLGYYARARNLHRCAQALVAQFDGSFPRCAETIATLPGIGPSTAAAIAAFSFGERAPIMDGNVKRVFTRHFGIEGDPARRDIDQQLWTLARAQVHAHDDTLDMVGYTQGLMDMGATLCTRRSPSCDRCPVAATCTAKREGRQATLPTPKIRKAIPERSTAMLIISHGGAVLLAQRPQTGIWGGLWSLPECGAEDAPLQAVRAMGLEGDQAYALAAFAHTFTHYRLHVRPWFVPVQARPLGLPAGTVTVWVDTQSIDRYGLPAPVKKLLEGVFDAGLATDPMQLQPT